ncbi:hypothetical protein BMR03_07475 [Methylococcaceae bacterium HT2]|nr:hypothetical protein BMR03_07475 [Methylococcaceae bacterium HT2]
MLCSPENWERSEGNQGVSQLDFFNQNQSGQNQLKGRFIKLNNQLDKNALFLGQISAKRLTQ